MNNISGMAAVRAADRENQGLSPFLSLLHCCNTAAVRETCFSGKSCNNI